MVGGRRGDGMIVWGSCVWIRVCNLYVRDRLSPQREMGD